jgi:hypothetical protein
MLVVLLAGMLTPIAGFAAQPSIPFLLRRGTIVDSARGVACVAKPNGRIDAVELAGGRTLWTSADAALPLGVYQGLLAAQFEEKPWATERFQVVFLDVASGRKVSEATITLPAGVRALVADEKGKSFRATAQRQGILFLVSWYYKENLVNGIAPKVGEPTMRLFAGSALISPQTGTVGSVDEGQVGDVPEQWKTYGSPPPPPWQPGTVSARTEGGRGGPLTLKRTDAGSGRQLQDRTLSNQAIAAVPSADQRHLLASERVGEGGPDDPEYRWVIFAMDTADRATELRRDVSAAPFFVFSDSVIFESTPHGYLRGGVRVDEPLEIQSIRLSSGVPKWKVELRDLSYLGPRPPAR